MDRINTFEELSQFSFRLRTRWKINSARPDLMRILREEFPKDFPEFQLAIIPDDTPHDVMAFCDRVTNTIGIRQYIEDANSKGNDHAMNILGEEIAHYVLRHPGRLFRKTDDVRARSFVIVGLREREAKLLYAMILAPEQLAENCSSDLELVKKYGLEPETAQIYFEELTAYRRRQAASKPKSALLTVVQLGKQADTKTAPAKRKFEFKAPKNGLIAVVAIEMDSKTSRCVADVPAKDRGWVSIDFEGERTVYQFATPDNVMYVQQRRGKFYHVRFLHWHDPNNNTVWERDVRSDPTIARELGYSGETCQGDCRSLEVIRDGNCLTCNVCGWTTSVS